MPSHIVSQVTLSAYARLVGGMAGVSALQPLNQPVSQTPSARMKSLFVIEKPRCEAGACLRCPQARADAMVMRHLLSPILYPETLLEREVWIEFETRIAKQFRHILPVRLGDLPNEGQLLRKQLACRKTGMDCRNADQR